jgi:hypothetical protein
MSAVDTREGACVAPSRDSRHDVTDARWYVIGEGEETVLVFPHDTYRIGAVLSARRALVLIAEHAPEQLVETLAWWIRVEKHRKEVKT